MKSKVYIETSVISYLTARPSRDILVAANQQVTQDGGRIAANNLIYLFLSW